MPRSLFLPLAAAVILCSCGLQAQQLQPPAPSQSASAPAFEVATIKPAAPSPDGHTHINHPPGDRFSAQNITLLALLSWAYRLPQNQILDAPSWFAITRFDLQAKLDTSKPSPELSNDEDQARKRQMLESLLAERCSFAAHSETRILPAYDLVQAKGGSLLKPSASSGKSINTYHSGFEATGLTLPLIAEQLSYIAGRVVIDKTNLAGRYDLKLQWTLDNTPATEEQAFPTLFTAIQEQLGLKLDTAREPVAVLVIDHVDPPSEN